jgi:hypothetical protein
MFIIQMNVQLSKPWVCTRKITIDMEAPERSAKHPELVMSRIHLQQISLNSSYH